MLKFSILLLIILLISGCSDNPWNNPNPLINNDNKVYFSNFQIRPKHLDPARSYSADEGIFIDQIYEPPLEYNYFKKPYSLDPLTLQALPDVIFLDNNFNPVNNNKNGEIFYTKYILHLKKGMYYQPHPAFAKNNKKEYIYHFNSFEEGRSFSTLADFNHTDFRELIANDYAYQIKRMADPRNFSPIKSLLSTYILGFKELSLSISSDRENQSNEQLLDWINLDKYDIPGLKVVNNYTIEITINGLYPQFKYWLAMRFFSPIPWEADRFYHNPGFKQRNLSLDWFPVGSGPFMLTKNNPNGEMILSKNPNYSHGIFPFGPENHPSKPYYGRKLPLIDEAIFRLEKETLPLFTKFSQGYYDRSGENHSNIGSNTFDQVFNFGTDGLELTPEMKEKKITIEKDEQPAIYYTGFNMLDPVVGGYEEEKRSLRQAISIAYDDQEYIDIFFNGQGSVAQSPIPPGIPGFRHGKSGINPFVFNWENNTAVRKPIQLAKELLAKAGYPNGRHKTSGNPLILYLDISSNSNPSSSILDWKRKQFKKIGIQLEFRLTDYNRFKDKIRQGNTQLFSWGWLADYPDPENFLFLLYGPNSSASCNCDSVNNTNYNNPHFNSLYKQIKIMENSDERNKLIDEMLQIVRKDAPWIFGFTPTEYYLNNPWVYNNTRHGVAKNLLKYVDVDSDYRNSQQYLYNQPNKIPIFAATGLVFLIVFPAVKAYRRRQKETI